MAAYYNEIEPYAAQWLRNLIDRGQIPAGEVDTRSILDVSPEDVRGFTQCHFFAGIGGWSYALRLAQWPDTRAVWTGSCPCQPFSVAGRGDGMRDERHLWPYWFALIEQCRPRVVLGEQVEAAIKHDWLDLVWSDLEGIGYAVAPVGVPAAGVGAPHIRHRLWFVADDERERRKRRPNTSRPVGEDSTERSEGVHHLERDGSAGRVADDDDEGLPPRERQARRGEGQGEEGATVGELRSARGGVADDDDEGFGIRGAAHNQSGRDESGHDVDGRGETFWSPAEWIWWRDDKYRPVEPGTFPLAHGVSNRVGRLRAYGNAIVPQVAAEVIRAYMDVRGAS